MQRGRAFIAMAGVALLAVGALLLHLPLRATADIASSGYSDRAGPDAPPPSAAPRQRAAPGTYQLRCWQYGRLLFEEGPVTLGAEARQSARLVATDRNGATLIVSDAGGTTCLARPAAAPPSLALPR